VSEESEVVLRSIVYARALARCCPSKELTSRAHTSVLRTSMNHFELGTPPAPSAASVVATPATVPDPFEAASTTGSRGVIMDAEGTWHNAMTTAILEKRTLRSCEEELLRSTIRLHLNCLRRARRHANFLCPMIAIWAATLVASGAGGEFPQCFRELLLQVCELAIHIETISIVPLLDVLALTIRGHDSVFPKDTREASNGAATLNALMWALKCSWCQLGGWQPSAILLLRHLLEPGLL